jgi:hypothetical protein
LAIQASGLDDKEVYLSLGIDAGHWSRIRKGEAHFPMDKIADFCRCVGNRVLPEWLAFQKRRSAGRTSAACSKQRTAAR